MAAELEGAMFMKLKSKLLVGALLAMGISGVARADSVTFTTNPASDSDGAVSATVTFTVVQNGEIEVTVADTVVSSVASPFAKGQAISSLSFSVNGISTPTMFTEFQGRAYQPVSDTAWTSTSGTAFDTTSNSPPINAIDNWGFSPTGSSVLLASAGSPVPGSGNPIDMILPSSGVAASGKSLANGNFDPFAIGPVNFFFTVPNITTSTVLTTGEIYGVNVGFGTGPDTVTASTQTTPPGGGTPPPVPSPLPASASAGLVLLGLCGGFVMLRKRRELTVSE